MSSNLNDFKTQTSTFQNAINQAATQANDIGSNMKSSLNSLKDSGDSVNGAGNALSSGATAVFAICLTFSLIAIISLVLVKFCNLKIFNKFAHISWCLLGLFTIFGFLMASILYPVSILAVEVCDIFNAILNDRPFLKKTFDSFSISTDVFKTIDTCFYGSGNILDQVGGVNQLSLLNSTVDQLNVVKQFNYSTNGLPKSIVIPIQKQYVAQFINGQAPDGQPAITDLATLNGQTSPGCVKDTWYLNSANCSNNGQVISSTDAAGTNAGSQSCLGVVDSWGGRGAGYTAATTTRYGTCPGTTTVNLLNNFVSSRNVAADSTHFGGIKTLLDTLDADNNLYMRSIEDMVQNFTKINDAISGIMSDLTDPNRGILTNVNCQFIKPNLNRIYDALCVGVITNMYQTSVVLIVLSFFTLFGTCFVFCVAKRALLTDDQAKQ